MNIFADAKDKKDAESIAYNTRNRRANEIFRTLKNMHSISFELGDFLIRQDSDWLGRDGEVPDDAINVTTDEDGWRYYWTIEKFSKANSTPRKYQVVYIDEVGIPYVQKVKMNGELSGDARCLAGFDPSSTRFVHDPDFVDHTILVDEDENYDPQAVYREKRHENRKLRKTAKVK